MPIPGAGQQGPMASQQAMGASGQATRKSTREVPREQLDAAMRQGADAVAQALYGTKEIGKAAMQMIQESDKVGSTAKAATQLLSEVNKRAQLPERIMVPLAIMTADEVMDMAEQANRTTFSDQEAQQVVLTTAEMVLQSYGVPPERAQQLAQQASQQELKQAENAFNSALDGAQQQETQPDA
jgi:hypothetical protein